MNTMKQVHDEEILIRNATMDILDQGKTDELKVTDENSSNQKIQMDDGGCERPSDEALNDVESLPASSETEKIILEESTASKNPDGELGKDDKPDNAPVEPKPCAYVIEEVTFSISVVVQCKLQQQAI